MVGDQCVGTVDSGPGDSAVDGTFSESGPEGSSGSGSGGSSGDAASDGGDSSSGGDAGGPLPTIAITAPAQGAVVKLPAPPFDLQVYFALTNFTLYAPADPGCPATSSNCGYIWVQVDGTACRANGPGYNNDDTTGSPAIAHVGYCANVYGQHTIELDLHHSDDTPILDSNMVSTIGTSVWVNATQ